MMTITQTDPRRYALLREAVRMSAGHARPAERPIVEPSLASNTVKSPGQLPFSALSENR